MSYYTIKPYDDKKLDVKKKEDRTTLKFVPTKLWKDI